MEGTVDLKLRMLGWSALLALALAGVAATMARHLTYPMAALRQAIERVTAAIKAGKEPPPIPQVDGFLETRILSSSMRELVHSETAHRQALQALNERLEAAVAERTAELQAMRRARRVGRPCALLFLDMDGFKAVNDNHGHEEGDELLRQFGMRLAQGVRKTDMVARLAGDEFVVVLEMLADAGHAEETAYKLLERVKEPYTLRSAAVTVGASIGIALHRPEDPLDVDALLARADHAMYAVKRTGKNGVALAAAV
jgi:diguanylate cyclase (GGDEF)-like protein